MISPSRRHHQASGEDACSRKLPTLLASPWAGRPAIASRLPVTSAVERGAASRSRSSPAPRVLARFQVRPAAGADDELEKRALRRRGDLLRQVKERCWPVFASAARLARRVVAWRHRDWAVTRPPCLNPGNRPQYPRFCATASLQRNPSICRDFLWCPWISPVIRVGEVPGSNPGAPTQKTPQMRGFLLAGRRFGGQRLGGNCPIDSVVAIRTSTIVLLSRDFFRAPHRRCR